MTKNYLALKKFYKHVVYDSIPERFFRADPLTKLIERFLFLSFNKQYIINQRIILTYFVLYRLLPLKFTMHIRLITSFK